MASFLLDLQEHLQEPFQQDATSTMHLVVGALAALTGVAWAQFGNNGAPVSPSLEGYIDSHLHAQFPNVTYPSGVSPNPNAVAGAQSNQISPPKYPSPWGTGAGDWAAAYEKAIAIVEQLTLEEKVNLTTGQYQSLGFSSSLTKLQVRVGNKRSAWVRLARCPG